MRQDSQCAQCPFAHDKTQCICCSPEGKSPEFCPTVRETDVLQEALALYQQGDTMTFATEAARQEAACFIYKNGVRIPTKPRIVEVVEFCKRMGYRHVGLAFCGGVHKEAKIVAGILEGNDLQVTSVRCKVGCMDKSFLGLTSEEKNERAKHESMCNPIAQALILNKADTEFNLVFGLCVGHDSLFLEHSKARCSVLAVKDRVMGHNPMAALYLSDTYYKFLKAPMEGTLFER